ncbi:hypothetical protein FPSM_01656 [Flavobacterium psychrophilum]|nr:hypothetical protein FPSM_01656 [Flavobacterium psychrophilum]
MQVNKNLVGNMSCKLLNKATTQNPKPTTIKNETKKNKRKSTTSTYRKRSNPSQ